MAVNVTRVFQAALRELESERNRIDQQLTSLRAAFNSLDRSSRPRAGAVSRRRRRRRMNAAARRAVSLRMKAYWAKRRRRTTGVLKSRRRESS
jgi:hypothetical protein